MGYTVCHAAKQNSGLPGHVELLGLDSFGRFSAICYKLYNSFDVLFVFQIIGFDISCKFSPKETICMNCQSIFSEKKNRENITKTCLYDIDPLKPHFYIVKLGFTGVYVIFIAPAFSRV